MNAALRLAAFVLLTLPLMPLQQIFVWTWPAAARRFPHLYHRLVALILGVRVSVIGTPVRGLWASNHVSWLDIVVLSAVAPLSFIAKREVNRWPFFGSLARLQRTVFIDRDRRQSAGVARDDMQTRLAAGDTLVLFAEGTSGDGAHVLPFKSAFFAAADSVQPVTLAYRVHWALPLTRRHRPTYAWYGDMPMAPHLWQALRSGPIDVTVILHPPLTQAQAGNRKALAKATEDAVRRGLADELSGKGRQSVHRTHQLV